MIKNDENKRGIGSDINNNSNELNSTAPSSKKFRKDAKGNLILKKKISIKKTKHHAYFIDDIYPDKKIANIIDIESYKKYNLDEEIGEEDSEKPEEKIEDSKVVSLHGCCIIF